MAEPLRSDEVHACVHRVALARGAPSPVERAEETVTMARRRARALAHRRSTLALLAALHPDAARPRTVADTLAALERGEEVVLSPRLPVDVAGMRAAAVQALVRTGREGAFTYAPVVVKNHEVTEPAATRRLARGALDRLRAADAEWVEGVGTRASASMVRSGLALAHATRVLGALGHADGAGRAVVVDRRRTPWWLSLEGDSHPRFNLAAYDRLYDERRSVLVAHDRWAAGEGPYPTEPYWHRDCPDCPYAAHCAAELEARDDVSLVRFTSAVQQELLRSHGVTTRAALAALDPSSARRAREDRAADERADDVAAALGRRLERLDELIYRARVVVGGAPTRRVEAAAMGCRRADVEVDVDMESYEDATYLWGALVSVRAPVEGVAPGYHAFATFDELTDESEAALFARFWTWLGELRARVEGTGASIATYCFWSAAEDGAMDRAVERTPDPSLRRRLAEEVSAFRRARPAAWIDLHDVVSTQIQTEGPVGLKQLATAAGFAWRDPTPSGEASILWYELAVGDDPVVAQAHRVRLLEYNEDDCRATWALREWLDGPARGLAHRDEPPVGGRAAP